MATANGGVMLRYLKIQNLAVIDETQLDVEKGFVCITGESGAGKSIMVDALMLLAGGRGSSDLVRSGCEKAVVEAEFELDEVAEDLELLDGPQLFLRREISKDGKSRAFVNGALVANNVLQKYAEPAFDIHGQHGQQLLLKERTHLEMFDSQGQLGEQAHKVAAALSAFRKDFDTYWHLKETESQRRKDAEFIRHQLAEIEKVKPSEDDADLDLRLKKARNLDDIRQNGSEVIGLLNDSLDPNLRKLKRHLQALLEFQPTLKPYLDQVEGLAATLNELQNDISLGLEDDYEEDLGKLEDRETALNRLFLRYGRNIEEVLAEQVRLKEALKKLGASEGELEGLWLKLEKAYLALREMALSLLAARTKAKLAFEEKVLRGLKQLALPHAKFEVEMDSLTWPDKLAPVANLTLPSPSLRFLFSANPGEPLRALSKVASGGELSRLLLALIESSQQQFNRLLVFDEIDAGLGGETAHAVGAKLATLGQRHQVLCVTHFAQVARFSNQQIKLEKQIIDGRTSTRLVTCDYEGRVAELARLMGGDAQAEDLRDHARKLITQTDS